MSNTKLFQLSKEQLLSEDAEPFKLPQPINLFPTNFDKQKTDWFHQLWFGIPLDTKQFSKITLVKFAQAGQQLWDLLRVRYCKNTMVAITYTFKTEPDSIKHEFAIYFKLSMKDKITPKYCIDIFSDLLAQDDTRLVIEFLRKLNPEDTAININKKYKKEMKFIDVSKLLQPELYGEELIYLLSSCLKYMSYLNDKVIPSKQEHWDKLCKKLTTCNNYLINFKFREPADLEKLQLLKDWLMCVCAEVKCSKGKSIEKAYVRTYDYFPKFLD
jgi:hypothetical protein